MAHPQGNGADEAPTVSLKRQLDRGNSADFIAEACVVA